MTAFGACCPHCNTLFKVYPDQLRLHNGFVNCGACGRTFDAQAVLVFLPPNEVLFLDKKAPFVEGLPVLNAVVCSDRHSDENQASSPESPNASPDTTDHESVYSLDDFAAETGLPETPDAITQAQEHSENILIPPEFAPPANKPSILLFEETLNEHQLEQNTASSTSMSKLKKPLIYLLLLILIVVVIFATTQQDKMRVLIQKITQYTSQTQSLIESTHTIAQSIR